MSFEKDAGSANIVQYTLLRWHSTCFVRFFTYDNIRDQMTTTFLCSLRGICCTLHPTNRIPERGSFPESFVAYDARIRREFGDHFAIAVVLRYFAYASWTFDLQLLSGPRTSWSMFIDTRWSSCLEMWAGSIPILPLIPCNEFDLFTWTFVCPSDKTCTYSDREM